MHLVLWVWVRRHHVVWGRRGWRGHMVVVLWPHGVHGHRRRVHGVGAHDGRRGWRGAVVGGGRLAHGHGPTVGAHSHAWHRAHHHRGRRGRGHVHGRMCLWRAGERDARDGAMRLLRCEGRRSGGKLGHAGSWSRHAAGLRVLALWRDSVAHNLGGWGSLSLLLSGIPLAVDAPLLFEERGLEHHGCVLGREGHLRRLGLRTSNITYPTQ